MTLRVLVTGGRIYADWDRLCAALDWLHATYGIAELCHGDARGADRMAGRWAAERGVPVKAYPADWDTYGRAAGVLRNQAMLVDFHPSAAVAFPGSTGTADMVRRCAAAGLVPWKPYG